MESIKQHPMFRFLMVLTISSTIGLQGWTTLFNNFAVEQVGLTGSQVGLIQSVREIPGFLTLLAIFAMLVIKEHRLSALSVLFLINYFLSPFIGRCIIRFGERKVLSLEYGQWFSFSWPML